MYRSAAAFVLVVHLVWILWIIFGAFFTRGRPLLTCIHIAALGWGIAVEVGPWPCPLTLVEQFFETHAGIVPYQGGFLIHYLDAIVYPNLSDELLTILGVAVCAANLAIYAWRLWKWRLRVENSRSRASQ
ncbi:MAG TPA: DUF2784 domain-containing protein [Bryobacteraceae bacterium]|nr:DUF2784 domain-containing protein [Bryobacteraceae bacterium]